ncbi:uncharacterized protein EURHEDRAFT_526967 [Aspergillus ruber CBS 135680]|uniref:Uncharacterized protein n=1 Tax=Aspergillus ruber (strain CBS 135680) TaxID=1388766 RepID=A0A017S1H8_ASPRC|nr:uncharacterized protein EURHEDRAFT_526967 [Aspergillus ruber CBS 135680]EYE90479.1 hypothetical protein EURHEDRAFT_526967 [Aspergillus ruber CBS 135680]
MHWFASAPSKLQRIYFSLSFSLFALNLLETTAIEVAYHAFRKLEGFKCQNCQKCQKHSCEARSQALKNQGGKDEYTLMRLIQFEGADVGDKESIVEATSLLYAASHGYEWAVKF